MGSNNELIIVAIISFAGSTIAGFLVGAFITLKRWRLSNLETIASLDNMLSKGSASTESEPCQSHTN